MDEVGGLLECGGGRRRLRVVVARQVARREANVAVGEEGGGCGGREERGGGGGVVEIPTTASIGFGSGRQRIERRKTRQVGSASSGGRGRGGGEYVGSSGGVGGASCCVFFDGCFAGFDACGQFVVCRSLSSSLLSLHLLKLAHSKSRGGREKEIRDNAEADDEERELSEGGLKIVWIDEYMTVSCS